METKVCNSCNRELPIRDFSPNKTGYKGTMPSCKQCRRVIHRSYITTHKVPENTEFKVDIYATAYDRRTPLSELQNKRDRYKRSFRFDQTGLMYYQCGYCKLWFPLTLAHWPKRSNNPLVEMRFGGSCKRCTRSVTSKTALQYTKGPVQNKQVSQKWIYIVIRNRDGFAEYRGACKTRAGAFKLLRRLAYLEDPRFKVKGTTRLFNVKRQSIILEKDI